MLSAPERMIVPEPWPQYFTDVLASGHQSACVSGPYSLKPLRQRAALV